MSQFNQFAKEVEKVAKLAMAQYMVAESDLANAKKKMEDFPAHLNVHDPVYQARALVAKSEWQLAQTEFNAVRHNLVDEIETKTKDIRRELEAALDKAFAASPSQIDNNALELLKSGILRPEEYISMIDEAAAKGNFTMTRLVGKYAGDALEAEVKRNGNGPAASRLRLAIVRSREIGADGYLNSFDVIAHTARRCIENPGMQKYWEDTVGKIVENF